MLYIIRIHIDCLFWIIYKKISNDLVYKIRKSRNGQPR